MVANNNTETSPLLKSDGDNTSADNGSNTRKRSSQRRGGLYDLKTGYQTTINTTLTTKFSNDTTSSTSTSVATNTKKPPIQHRGSSLVNATLQPIENNNNNRPTISRNDQHIGSATSIQQRCTVIQQADNNKPITPTSFYYNPTLNPTIQRYYKFTSTKSTPFIALYKRPLEIYPQSTLNEHEIIIQRQYQNKPGSKGNQSDTTGLLTRSMVLPSHGTDPSGKWILVSVGGRKFLVCAYACSFCFYAQDI